MRRLIVIPLLALALTAQAGARPLTETEQAIITACETNVLERAYSPDEAEKCLTGLNNVENNFTLLDKMREIDEPRVRKILTEGDTIKDLRDYLERAPEIIPPDVLALRLENSQCRQLGLGPQPEKFFPWVDKYMPDKLEQVKKAAYSWDTLPEETRLLLSKDGITDASWAEQVTSVRKKSLVAWAERKYNEILPPGAERFTTPNYHQIAMAIHQYLPGEKSKRMLSIINSHNSAGAAPNAAKGNAPPGNASAAGSSDFPKTGKVSERLAKMQTQLNGLAGKPLSKQSELLNQAFDNAAPQQGKVKPPRPIAQPAPGKQKAVNSTHGLTDAQAEALTPRLQAAFLSSGKNPGELSDTPVGREIINFYKTPGNTLNLRIPTFQGPGIPPGGRYSDSDKTLSITKQSIEWAMEATGVTQEQLIDPKNAKAVGKIARFTAPTFVHEATHQAQSAWTRESKIPNPYILNMEDETFSKQSLFTLQKSRSEMQKGNLEYPKQIDEYDLKLANVLKKEGPGGIRRLQRYHLPTLELQAAGNFASYEGLEKELTLRELAAKKDPEKEKTIDAGRPEGQKTAVLEASLNSIYPWYKLNIKREQELTVYFQDALAELIGPTSGRGSHKTNTAPPKPW
jgi:hypothetical protein